MDAQPQPHIKGVNNIVSKQSQISGLGRLYVSCKEPFYVYFRMFFFHIYFSFFRRTAQCCFAVKLQKRLWTVCVGNVCMWNLSEGHSFFCVMEMFTSGPSGWRVKCVPYRGHGGGCHLFSRTAVLDLEVEAQRLMSPLCLVMTMTSEIV